MDYQRIYNLIIEKRKKEIINDGYFEIHHIIPRSLGGNDNVDNLIALTAREHFICHYLLAKIYPKDSFEWYKMNHAFLMMKASTVAQNRYFNSRLYDAMRKNFSKVMSALQTGINNSQHNTVWITNLSNGENKKITNNNSLPNGWKYGRTIGRSKNPVIKHCKKCGDEICSRPEICSKHQMIGTLIQYFGFNDKSLGSSKFYDEYDRIVKLINDEYNVKKLSIEDLKAKYCLTSNERMRYICKSLGIERRSLSQAVKNYSKKEKI